jgi:hypothetical protein
MSRTPRPSNFGKYWSGNLAYMHKTFCAAVSSPAFAQRGGSHRKRASAPLIHFHVVPRAVGSLCGGKNHSSEGRTWYGPIANTARTI